MTFNKKVFILWCRIQFWSLLKAIFLTPLMFGSCAVVALLPFSVVIGIHYHHFSPIQKYWFLTYCRSEFPSQQQGVYRLLVVEDTNKDDWLADAENVLPGVTSTTDGKEIPFVLAPKEQQEGKRLVLLPPTPQYNRYLWESQRDQIYDGKSLEDMGGRSLDTGLKLGLFTLFAVLAGLVFVALRRRLFPKYDTGTSTHELGQ